jgi:LuxR family maltose regulon positive regulatory protein
MQWLGSIQKALEKRDCTYLLIQTLNLKALTAEATGDSETAIDCVSKSVTLAESAQCLRSFIDEGEPMRELMMKAGRKGISSRFINNVLSLFKTKNAEIDSARVNDFGESFTKREREIASLLCNGATNDDIADRLYLSRSTIKNHIHDIYMKLGVKNRAQAIVRMQDLGLIDRLREAPAGHLGTDRLGRGSVRF